MPKRRTKPKRVGGPSPRIVSKGQTWLLVYGGQVVSMEVIGVDEAHVTLAEMPWPPKDPAPGEYPTRRVMVVSPEGLVASGALDDRKKTGADDGT